MPRVTRIAKSQCLRIFKDPRTEPDIRLQAVNIYLRLNGLLPRLGKLSKQTQQVGKYSPALKAAIEGTKRRR